MSLETITWIDVDSEMPDDDILVLVATPSLAEQVWPGYFDSEKNAWALPDGIPFGDRVTHWAQMPAGPQCPRN
jgi:hypothetical protein